jgi:dimethylaniline monooxygenase (N-oxide forming)
MDKKLNIGILGCGASGLVTLKEIMEEGHDGTIFEKSNVIGGLFTDVYQQGLMVSSNVITMFSDFVGGNSEEGDKELLTKPRCFTFIEYSKYLNDYADHFKLRSHIHFRTDIKNVWKDMTTGKWKVRVMEDIGGDEEKEKVYEFDRIAVCTGTHHKAAVPYFNGQEKFQGKIKHLRDVKQFEEFTGRRMCVVGSGEGASDLSLAAAKFGKTAFISIRADHGFIVPRYTNGPHGPSDLNTNRVRTQIPYQWGMSFSVIMLTMHLIRGYILKLFTGKDITIQKELYKMNIKQIKRANSKTTYGTKSGSIVEAIACYKCQRKPGIRELTEKTVIFEDGSEEEIDEILCCTGFQNQFPYLDTPDKEADPVHSKLVCQVAQAARISHDLYQHCVHPDFGEELFFIGFARPCFGAIPPLAEMQARWYALLCSKKLSLPDKQTMIRQTKQYVQYLEDRFTKYRTDRIVGLTDHGVYMDEIAWLIGCRPPLIRMFFTEPYIWLKCMCAPMITAQYRLYGPNRQPEKARKILRQVKWAKHLSLIILFLLPIYSLPWFFGFKSYKPDAWYPIAD